MTRLNATQLRAFLVDQSLNIFDPSNRELIATVTYDNEGKCLAIFANGMEDQGEYGLTGDVYWTRYTHARGGKMNEFYLVQVACNVAQAYHTDGRRAFLQSSLTTLQDCDFDDPNQQPFFHSSH